MGEPPAAAPAGVAASEQDVLLATKLHIPRPRPNVLARPQLLERVTGGTARELTVVCAPAGFGKTSLLGEWARRSQRPVAWLSLDRGDSDPARFWRYVAAALDGLRAGIHQQVAALLRGPQQPPLEAVMTVVVNELATLPGEVVLVLDDYHLLEAPPVHDSLAFLLERLPAQLRLVLASRADPPLPLARLRARGQLAELRARDLRFTLPEAAALLREATGLDLPAASVAALAARAEGWVAGLQLAALSLQGHADPARFVATFAGSHRFVLDYLTEEVLARQPEHLVRFLLETSVLDRLCGPLCDAVTGHADGQHLLEQAERANLFLVPLDEERRWWRYHHLFADLLRARLQQADPDRVAELHRAAAAWCEAHELGDDAIRHALAAADPHWAARLIERHLEEQILRRSEGATMARWLAALPDDAVSARPRLCLGQAISALLRGRADQAEPLIEAAERTSAVTAGEPYQPSVGREASILANIPAVTAVARADLARLRGDPEGEAALAQHALAQLTRQDGLLLGSFGRYHLAMADWLGGQLAKAEHGLAGVVAERSAAGERYLAVRACHDLGHIQQAQGRLDAALHTYKHGLDIASEPAHVPLPAAGIAHVGLSEVLYERNELDAAVRHATEGIARCRQLAYTPPLATGLVTLAWIRRAGGDDVSAMEAMDEAEQVMPSLSMADLFNPVPAQRARLLLAQGDVAAAARWAEERGLSAADQPMYHREREHLVLARVLLAQDRAGLALSLLDRLLAAAASQHRTGSIIEIRALQSLAFAATDDENAAVDALAEALTLACPRGYVRVFADAGAPMGALLARLVAAQRAEWAAARDVPFGCLAQVQRAFGERRPAPPSTPRTAAAAPGLVESLTTRELEVLALLAAGAPNQAIAGELVVSLDTAKKHVSHVLGKLGAANRTEAVTRARQLGLIP